MSGKWILGIDIGGTSIKFASVFDDGSLGFEPQRLMVDEFSRTQDGMVELVLRAFEQSCSHMGSKPAGIGIGAAGVIHRAESIRQSPNFPEWKDFPLAEMVSDRTGIKNVTLENDVNSIALAEHWRGSAAGVDNFVMAAIGTGLGGALFLGGQLWRGWRGMAGEIGHVNVVPHGGRGCNCGSTGCLETYVSQVGIVRSIEERFSSAEIESYFSDTPKSDWPMVLDRLARNGNTVARLIWQQAGELLGITFGSLLNVLDLEMIVIGGGLANAFDLYFDAMMEALVGHSFAAISEGVQVVRATLGYESGIIGAASVALGKSGIAIA